MSSAHHTRNPLKFLSEDLQKESLGRVQEKVIARHHPQTESARRVVAPTVEVFAPHFNILQTAEGSDGTVQRRARHVAVCLNNFKISTQERHHQLDQFGVFEHFLRCAVKTPQLLQKLRIGQVVRRWITLGNVRSTAARDEQLNRHQTVFFSQKPCQFETDHRAHAVPEKSKWFVEERQQSFRRSLNERFQSRERRFVQTSSATAQFDGTNLDRSWQPLLPATEDEISTAGVGKTEEAEVGLGNGPVVTELRARNRFGDV